MQDGKKSEGVSERESEWLADTSMHKVAGKRERLVTDDHAQ